MNNNIHPLVISTFYTSLREGRLSSVTSLLEDYPLLANTKDDAGYGDPPIVAATRAGHADICDILLKKGSNWDLLNQYGHSGLMIASNLGHIDVARSLLHYPIDMTLKDGHGNTAVLLAAREHNVEILQMILETGEKRGISGSILCNVLDKFGRSPLLWACITCKGKLDAIKLLLKHGADPNVTGPYGDSPMIEAAKRGNIVVMRELISFGTEVDIPEKNHKLTPLMFACRRGHSSCVELLLKHGADPEKTDVFGRTSLNMAVWFGHVESTEALLIFGRVNVNATTNDGDSILTCSAMQPGRPLNSFNSPITRREPSDSDKQKEETTTAIHIIRLLLEWGANPFPRGKDGKSVIDIARTEGVREALVAGRKWARSSLFFHCIEVVRRELGNGNIACELLEECVPFFIIDAYFESQMEAFKIRQKSSQSQEQHFKTVNSKGIHAQIDSLVQSQGLDFCDKHGC